MSRGVLIIEDEPILARNIKAYLFRYGYESMLAFSAEEGLAAMDSFRPSVVLLDYHLPDKNGLQVLEHLRHHPSGVKVIMMTAHGSVGVAVQAMKSGACDYLSKPVALCELKLLLDKTTGRQQLEPKTAGPHEQDGGNNDLDGLIGESAPMAALKENMRRLIASEYALADNDPPSVLITGETGTGKELVARALHFGGRRRSRPFIEINCAAMPVHLLEAELFGYERGAFTDARACKPGLLEEAQTGTLFLDEIGEAELSFQSKLLKVLEEKKVRRLGGLQMIPVNFRTIAASNQDLESRVAEGSFRADLYFRLRMMPLNLPPLRQRGRDVLLLARHFLQLHSTRYRKPGLFFTPGAEAALLDWSWPGNVRELRNVLEHVVLMAQGEAVHESQLLLQPARTLRPHAPAFPSSSSLPQLSTPGNPGDKPEADPLNLERLEHDCLVRALNLASWNVTRAAKLLGLSRDTLRYRMEKHGLKNTE